MSDLTFGIQIISSTVAIVAAYALIMSILQREVSLRWLRGETVVALLASLVAFSFGYKSLLSDNLVLSLSFALLLLGLGHVVALFFIHFVKVKKNTPYPAALVPTTKLLAILLFSIFVLHFLLELAAIQSI